MCVCSKSVWAVSGCVRECVCAVLVVVVVVCVVRGVVCYVCSYAETPSYGDCTTVESQVVERKVRIRTRRLDLAAISGKVRGREGGGGGEGRMREEIYFCVKVIITYVCVHAKNRFRVYLPKIELLHMMHHLCERHQLLQEQPPFPFLLRDTVHVTSYLNFSAKICGFPSWNSVNLHKIFRRASTPALQTGCGNIPTAEHFPQNTVVSRRRRDRFHPPSESSLATRD